MQARIPSLRRHGRLLAMLAAAVALTGLAAALLLIDPGAHVLTKATGVGGTQNDLGAEGTFGSLIDLANNLTDEAMIPTIALSPLAAVAGAFALLIGGGGRQGSHGVKLIAGAVGAVVIVALAKGLAY